MTIFFVRTEAGYERIVGTLHDRADGRTIATGHTEAGTQVFSETFIYIER